MVQNLCMNFIMLVKKSLFIAAVLLVFGVNAFSANLEFALDSQYVSDPGDPLTRELTITNAGNQATQVNLTLNLQLDSEFEAEAKSTQSEKAVEFVDVGMVVETMQKEISVPAGESTTVSLKLEQPLKVGFYLLSIKADSGQEHYLIQDHQMVLHESMPELPEDSRFGMNSSKTDYIDTLRRLGVGWIRFENFKWQFYNPSKEEFAFDGSVGPWHVDADAMLKQYTDAGFKFAGYNYQTPAWATSAPKDVDRKRWFAYPPKDVNDYAEGVFQMVARFGDKHVAASELKTGDKVSGKGELGMLEMWNEVNLTDPNWGFWNGNMDDYFKMFRPAAEASKKADPDVIVSHSSFAGVGLELVDQLRTYTYPDGKHPLDFTDIINVHFYTGKALPEVATLDPNSDRSGKPSEGFPTIESNLVDLNAWRNQYKPGAEIWLTETGYDVGGKIGSTLRMHCAKLPRCMMMAMANGVDKIFWYREKGSTPAQHAGAGILDNDEQLRPSWLTFATLIRELNGAGVGDSLQLPYPDKNVRVYLWKTDHGPVLTAWAIEGGATVNLDLGKVTRTDAFGHKTEVDMNGQWSVGDFPIYISGVQLQGELLKLKDEAVAIKIADQKKLEMSTSLNIYAFDFGTEEYRGLLRGYGLIRPFETVTKETGFSESRGYGFTERATMDGDASYMRRLPLERDFTRFSGGTEFTANMQPGTYIVEGRASALKKEDTVTLVITDASGKTSEYAVRNTDSVGKSIEGTLTVTRSPVRIKFSGGYTNCNWLAFIEEK